MLVVDVLGKFCGRVAAGDRALRQQPLLHGGRGQRPGDFLLDEANHVGRRARLMTDVLVRNTLGQPAFTWGSGDRLIAASEVRARYLAALRAADQSNYRLLLAFVRS